jgi:hypothetical protein
MGKLVISAPPVPPAMQRAGYHVHDGFYLRLAAGIGGGRTSVSTDRTSVPNFGVGGAGLALNLWIGGTPWRGVALGGLVSYQGLNDGDTVVEGEGTGAGMTSHNWLIGPFIDVFPDPQRGLHFGGSLALAAVNTAAHSHLLEETREVKDYSGGGLGASAWIGYMGFVGPEYSMGGLLQLSGYGTVKKDSDVERKASGYSVSLSFSALYH